MEYWSVGPDNPPQYSIYSITPVSLYAAIYFASNFFSHSITSGG